MSFFYMITAWFFWIAFGTFALDWYEPSSQSKWVKMITWGGLDNVQISSRRFEDKLFKVIVTFILLSAWPAVLYIYFATREEIKNG
jgi:hypothetical protein